MIWRLELVRSPGSGPPDRCTVAKRYRIVAPAGIDSAGLEPAGIAALT